MKDDHTVPMDMRTAAERCLATPGTFAAPIGDAMTALAELQRIAAALGPLIPLASELRAERDRMQATLAQMQGEVARLRGLVAALEGAMEARVAHDRPETPADASGAVGGHSAALRGDG